LLTVISIQLVTVISTEAAKPRSGEIRFSTTNSGQTGVRRRVPGGPIHHAVIVASVDILSEYNIDKLAWVLGAPHLDPEMWVHSSEARTASLKGTASAVPNT